MCKDELAGKEKNTFLVDSDYICVVSQIIFYTFHFHFYFFDQNLSYKRNAILLFISISSQQGNFKMYQRNGTNAPNAPHQVVYIIQAPKEKVNIKDAYNIKAATALGVIHIICGFIALGSDIASMVDAQLSPAPTVWVATGIWTSVFFLVSGGLAIGGARSGNKCLVVATMVMAIISAISAGIMLIISAILLHLEEEKDLHFFGYRSYGVSHVSYGLLIAMGATMLIVATASALLTCYPLCCRSAKQGAVHYQPKQVLCLCLCHTLTTITN